MVRPTGWPWRCPHHFSPLNLQGGPEALCSISGFPIRAPHPGPRASALTLPRHQLVTQTSVKMPLPRKSCHPLSPPPPAGPSSLCPHPLKSHRHSLSVVTLSPSCFPGAGRQCVLLALHTYPRSALHTGVLPRKGNQRPQEPKGRWGVGRGSVQVQHGDAQGPLDPAGSSGEAAAGEPGAPGMGQEPEPTGRRAGRDALSEARECAGARGLRG